MRFGSYIAVGFLTVSVNSPALALPLLQQVEQNAPVIQVQFAPSDVPPPVLHGFRGVRDRQPGYRFHQGWWFPLEAFVVAPPPPPVRPIEPDLSPRHIAWCSKRYRTYDPDTNIYISKARGAVECVSPYF
ncbi:BA14K family protein [Agrobacterium rhizogenes]|uniref:BA14K family protein n=1 Tax=Rhizobium rhizogenes TaxID=359 RepID=UPI000DDCA671|nr:BA14K family protein [Rhizobium rhizogenes]KAA6487818.1 hypothetical protein DXT98_12695 [Agrobacterium sp. ICMP 7243]NTF83876.1 BA14K family protein [Rhizobium rhizogenes]NTG03277.1 BA14K family protein [Rhizobium rhizogenes]NTG16759.1 BA14K family protein [Rhizobium rhizogenes]NTG23461.1 BA14K family protein [Rhizobium rhizogenes]